MGSSSAAYPPLPGAHLEKIAEEHAVVFNALVRQLLGQLCGRLPAHTREQHHDVGRSARQACKSALPEEQDLLQKRIDRGGARLGWAGVACEQGSRGQQADGLVGGRASRGRQAGGAGKQMPAEGARGAGGQTSGVLTSDT
eukprot:364781-Chlamydomonas_euryale.AAC.10